MVCTSDYTDRTSGDRGEVCLVQLPNGEAAEILAQGKDRSHADAVQNYAWLRVDLIRPDGTRAAVSRAKAGSLRRRPGSNGGTKPAAAESLVTVDRGL